MLARSGPAPFSIRFAAVLFLTIQFLGLGSVPQASLQNILFSVSDDGYISFVTVSTVWKARALGTRSLSPMRMSCMVWLSYAGCRFLFNTSFPEAGPSWSPFDSPLASQKGWKLIKFADVG